MLRVPRRHLLRGGGAFAATKLFAPSIIKPASAAFVLGKAGGGGGGGYVAKAVHLADDTRLGRLGLTVPDNSKFTLSYWYKIASLSPDTTLFEVHDINNNVNPTTFQNSNDWNVQSDLSMDCYDPTNTDEFTIVTNPGSFVIDIWTHKFFSGDTNFSAGNKKGFSFLNGVSDLLSLNDSSPAFNIGWNGYGFGVPAPPAPDSGVTIRAKDYCDIQLWVGTIVDPTLHIDKFISGGKPVDPAVATAAFGQQSFLFSGDATTFSNNQGSAGACTVSGTALTNATTSPSD